MTEWIQVFLVFIAFGAVGTITEMLLIKKKNSSISSPSMFSKIKRFLRIKPSAQEQIIALGESKAFIETQRAGIDEKIAQKEKTEFDLMDRGSRTSSELEKRQIANKVARIRNELRFERNTAHIYSQQLLVIEQYTHSLQMSKQLSVQLPNCEELAKCAAKFEESLTSLSATSDFAMSITKDASTDLMREQEASIMDEFKQIEAQKEQQKEQQKKESLEKMSESYGNSAKVPPIATKRNKTPEKA